MRWLKKLFQKKTNNKEKTPEVIFCEKIETGQKKCANNKVKFYAEITQIKKWATELILEVYKVHHSLWYEELDKYEAIKALPANKNLSKNLIKKTNEIIEGYKMQIELKFSKIEFCDLSIKKYDKLLFDYKQKRKELQSEKQRAKKFQKIEIHSNRLAELDENSFGSENKIQIKLDFLQDEVKEIEEELHLQEEITRQLDKLYEIYGSKNDIENTHLYKKELRKLKIKN